MTALGLGGAALAGLYAPTPEAQAHATMRAALPFRPHDDYSDDGVMRSFEDKQAIPVPLCRALRSAGLIAEAAPCPGDAS